MNENADTAQIATSATVEAGATASQQPSLIRRFGKRWTKVDRYAAILFFVAFSMAALIVCRAASRLASSLKSNSVKPAP